MEYRGSCFSNPAHVWVDPPRAWTSSTGGPPSGSPVVWWPSSITRPPYPLQLLEELDLADGQVGAADRLERRHDVDLHAVDAFAVLDLQRLRIGQVLEVDVGRLAVVEHEVQLLRAVRLLEAGAVPVVDDDLGEVHLAVELHHHVDLRTADRRAPVGVRLAVDRHV